MMKSAQKTCKMQVKKRRMLLNQTQAQSLHLKATSSHAIIEIHLSR